MDITHPSTAGFASDTRRSDLRGTDAIDRRHGGKVYLPFILLVLPLLPRQPAAVAEPDGRSAEFRSLAAAVAGLRHVLNKEYQFCMNNAERIQKKANKIYAMVTTNRKQILTDNSCAFHILEDGCREYIDKYLKSDSK